MDFLFDGFMKAVVWLCVRIGTLLGAGIHGLILLIARSSTSLPAQTNVQKKELDENARLAGCRELVLEMVNQLGFIAREAISREELEKKIDSGITPDELRAEIYSRMHALPGIYLGSIGQNGHAIKLPMSLRDRHTYIIGKSGSGKTNLIRTMILQDLAAGNGIGVLAPELELLTELLQSAQTR